MKKGILIGALIGVVTSIVIVLLYFVVVGKRSTEAPVQETTTAYMPLETTVAATEPATTVAESAEQTVQETQPEETPVADVTWKVIYGDTNEVLYLPKDGIGSYTEFMDVPGVKEMLGTLLFDVDVEWQADTYSYTGSTVYLKGITTSVDGRAELNVDLTRGQCELSTQTYTPTPQSKDDFTRPGTTPESKYNPGVKLADIRAQTVSTVVVDVRDILDWDSTAGSYAVPDTLRVVTKDFPNQSDTIDTYLRYVHHYFGDGDILIWDYDKVQWDIIVIYGSINDWNVAVQLRGGEPFVIRATAEPTGNAFNPYQ